MVAPSIKRKKLANLEAERLREEAQKGPVKKVEPDKPKILRKEKPKVKKVKEDTSW
jgi:hypothetical protein